MTPDIAPMLAPLPVPRVPLGFPPLAVVGGQTAHPNSHTVSGTEAGGQTALGVEAGSPTANPGCPIIRPCIAPLSPTSSTSAAPFVAHEFGCAPRGTLDSNYATRGPGVHDSGRATRGSYMLALPAALLVLPSGCAGASSTASTSVVTASEARTSGTSD
jgi:hypothetical protein